MRYKVFSEGFGVIRDELLLGVNDEFAEIAEMVLPWWTSQSDGTHSQPSRGCGLRARDRSQLFGRPRGGGPAIRSDHPFSARHGCRCGERYLVSMLGEEVNWVRNVKAAGGNATLLHGRREEVHLQEVAADRRAPVLKAYLQRAPGARAHLPIDKDTPLAEFEQVSPRFPVFRVGPRNT